MSITCFYNILIFLISTYFVNCHNQTSSSSSLRKNGRLLPLFGVVTFRNSPCEGSSENGTCFTQSECDLFGGRSSGVCAAGYGVCCIFELKCGQTSSQNCTYLRSAKSSFGSECLYTICSRNLDICRIRLDFEVFEIADPIQGLTGIQNRGGGIGDCNVDQFSITNPGNGLVPVICGLNTGHHMLIDTNSNQCHDLSFFMIGAFDRKWDIKVTQYRCTERDASGPPGCLQYYTGNTGTLKSFNFKSVGGDDSTHLSSHNYNICIRREEGNCRICYSAAEFGLSITSEQTRPEGATDSNCISDYVTIPVSVGTGNRFCGRKLTNFLTKLDISITVCSFQIPFQLGFVTDNREEDNGSNERFNESIGNPTGHLGFLINYVQDGMFCTP